MKQLFLIPASLLIASAAMAQSSSPSGCITAPVNITGNQVTLTSSGDKVVTDKQVYVYFSQKRLRRHEQACNVAAISDKYPSRPLMLNSDKSVKAVPETYNVTLNTPDANTSVCPDSALNIIANISVEKVSTYTGNYPDSKNDMVYKKVPKREYKMAARKMRKIKRNEERIARKTNTVVEAKSEKA